MIGNKEPLSNACPAARVLATPQSELNDGLFRIDDDDQLAFART